MFVEILPDFWMRYDYIVGTRVQKKTVKVYVDTGVGVWWEKHKFASDEAAITWTEDLRKRVTTSVMAAHTLKLKSKGG